MERVAEFEANQLAEGVSPSEAATRVAAFRAGVIAGAVSRARVRRQAECDAEAFQKDMEKFMRLFVSFVMDLCNTILLVCRLVCRFVAWLITPPAPASPAPASPAPAEPAPAEPAPVIISAPCAVCFGDKWLSSGLYACFKCRNTFHKHCIDKSVQQLGDNRCPFCRSEEGMLPLRW